MPVGIDPLAPPVVGRTGERRGSPPGPNGTAATLETMIGPGLKSKGLLVVDEPTLGELFRRLSDLQASADRAAAKQETYVRATDLAGYERRISALESALAQLVKTVADLAAHERRISAIESTLTWVVRTVGGCIILALLGTILIQGTGK